MNEITFVVYHNIKETFVTTKEVEKAFIDRVFGGKKPTEEEFGRTEITAQALAFNTVPAYLSWGVI